MDEKKKNGANKALWLRIIGGIILIIGLWQLYTNLYQDEEWKLRRNLRETVKNMFPEETAKYSQSFGLVLFETDLQDTENVDFDRNNIVLVHGLDNPGEIWQDLAPELAIEGFNVWLMIYPNDQPIVESSLLLFEELKKLTRQGIRKIAIVSHSMGGLVSREMLTRPDIGYNQSANNKQVPEVSTLIMVGTPNHGSQLARLRVFSEIRDQWNQLIKGEGSWLGAILDGAGEAKIDLLPGSRFLTELNTRPHPEGVDMMIIAGIISKWEQSNIELNLNKLRDKIPNNQQYLIDEISRNMTAMSNGLGDGLVSLESAGLKGVPLQTVEGTHMTMIRNISKDSRSIPPAVPIIIDQLKSKPFKTD